MSDLASVVLEITGTEEDAFWCFAAIMDDHGMARNFDHDQQGMTGHLTSIALLLRFVDPGLFNVT